MQIQDYSPKIIICSGVTAGMEICLETTARNMVDAPVPYNCGTILHMQKLENIKRMKLYTRLPVNELNYILMKQQIPVRISHDAGLFGCNQIFFHLMSILTRNNLGAIGGFIHVPGSIWSLEQLIKAFQLIITTIIKLEYPASRFDTNASTSPT